MTEDPVHLYLTSGIVHGGSLTDSFKQHAAFSFGRHQQKPVLGVRDWAVHLEDAARVIDETDSDEESGPEE